jgi:hypothetical protein
MQAEEGDIRRKRLKGTYLIILTIILILLVLTLGLPIFGEAALQPTVMKIAVIAIIGSVVVGEFADDIFENPYVIYILELGAEATLFGMLWALFYVYVRKGLTLVKNPAVMADGFYGGLAMTNMVFWGKLTLFAFDNFRIEQAQSKIHNQSKV